MEVDRPIPSTSRDREESPISSEQLSNPEQENPYLHLKDFVLNQGMKKLNEFKCVKCPPQINIVKTQVGSLCNLKSHLKRRHPSSISKYEQLCRESSSRGKHKRTTPTPTVSSSRFQESPLDEHTSPLLWDWSNV